MATIHILCTPDRDVADAVHGQRSAASLPIRCDVKLAPRIPARDNKGDGAGCDRPASRPLPAFVQPLRPGGTNNAVSIERLSTAVAGGGGAICYASLA